MPLLLNNAEPFLRILNPDGTYTHFLAGKLQWDETITVIDRPAYEASDGSIVESIEHEEPNPYYEHVMAEAIRRPTIQIIVNATTCPECGEVFAGKLAKAELGKHRKAVHFEKWLEDSDAAHAETRQKELKKREPFTCDVCQPTQAFPTADELGEHVALLHTSKPALDDDGRDIGGANEEGGGEGRRPGEVEPPKPATAKEG